MFEADLNRAINIALGGNVLGSLEFFAIARRAADDEFDQAHADDLCAHFLMQVGRYEQSLAYLDLARMGYEVAGHLRLAATCSETLGDALFALGHVSDAAIAYAVAIDVYNVECLFGAGAGCRTKLLELQLSEIDG